MGEEVRMSEYEVNGESNGGGDEERIVEWEMGLPNGEDLTPLSQSLIPPELASAFSITPITFRSLVDVNRASETTLSSIRGGSQSSTNVDNGNIKSFAGEACGDPMVVEMEETEQNGSGSESRRTTRKAAATLECLEEADSAAMMNSNEDPSSARTMKRPRLVWTPQLHKRFVDVVAHLGIKNAVPKTIMQLMNVEGLTRENVASHLQKYRLYLKRMQGLSNDDPSSSDQLFASTPVPPQCLHYENGGNSHSNNNNNNDSNNNNHHNSNCNNNGHMGVPIPGPYRAPQMMPMPVYGMMNQGFHHGHGFEANMYNMNMNMGMNNMMQQRDWSVNKHGSVVPYQHHVAPSSTDK